MIVFKILILTLHGKWLLEPHPRVSQICNFFGWHPLHHVGLRVQWYLINLLFKTLWFTVLLADSSMNHTHSLISACFIKFKYTIWSDLNLVWHVGLGRTTSLIIQVLMQNMWVRTASASWWYDKYNYDPET